MFQHFIITRFSVRIADIMNRKGLDPLDHRRLSYRWKLFQTACFPSVMSQEHQDFTWLILVDKALSPAFREKLQNLINVRGKTELVFYSPGCNYAALDWLRPWMLPETTTIATTHLDDDDALATGFTRYIHDRAIGMAIGLSSPLFLIMAGKTATMWDLLADNDAPYGYIKPDLTQRFPVSVGLTMWNDIRVNLSVLAIPHHLVPYLPREDHSYPADIPHINLDVARLRQVITNAVSESGLTREGGFGVNMIHYFPDMPSMLMMLNHVDNIQMFRFLSEEGRRLPFSRNEQIPGFSVNMELAAQIARKNKPGVLWLFRMWIRAARFRESYEKGRSLPYIIYRKLIGFRALFRAFRKMRKH